MHKSCLNCIRMMPVLEGNVTARRECMLNPGMRVNGRMHCEEWRSNDITGASSMSNLRPRTVQELIEM